MGNIRRQIVTFCKAETSAVVASAVDFAVTLMLAEVIGIWYGYATFVGALSGGVVNCSVNYRWVFTAQHMGKTLIAVRYLLVWGGSIVLNTLFTYFVTEYAGINYIIAKVAVAVMVAVLWNYQMQRSYVFASSKCNIDNNQ